MFSDPDVATRVFRLMRRLAGELNDSLFELEPLVPREEWVEYRYGVGAIMGEMFSRVTYVLAERHPELKSLIYGTTGADTGRTNEEIAASWISHYAREGRPATPADIRVNDDDPDYWAIRVVSKLIRDDPTRALGITFQIARSTSDEWVLENLGAGPLEDLIENDRTLLDPIEIEAASSVTLKLALQCVWQREMSDETWDRLQRIARS